MTNLSPEIIERLEDLLKSNEIDNWEMAVFFLKNNAIPEKLKPLLRDNSEKVLYFLREELTEPLLDIKELDWSYINWHIFSLKNFPPAFTELTQLEVLNLKGNRFNNFPIQLTRFPNLREINLAYNFFNTLPEEIKYWENIEKLDLSFNTLEALPDEIGELGNLKYLSLQGRQKPEFPESFAQLTNLETLHLAENQFDEEVLNRLKADLPQLEITFPEKEEDKKSEETQEDDSGTP